MAKKIRQLSTYDPRRFGAKCDHCPLRGSIPCPPARNQLKLAVLIDSPSDWDVRKQQPASGFTGDHLRTMLNKLQIGEHDTFIGHVLACKAPKDMNLAEQRQAFDCCSPRLERELRKSKVTTVLGLGKFLRQFWLPMLAPENSLGTAFPFKRWTLFPGYYPGEVAFGKPFLQPLQGQIFVRAAAWARGNRPTWKWPRIITQPNQVALKTLQAMAEQPTVRVGFDVETQGIDPLRHKVMCLAISQGDVSVCLPWDRYSSERYGEVRGLLDYPLGRQLWDLVKQIIETNPTVTHNGQHDSLAMLQYGISINYIYDTIISHSTLTPQAHGYRGLEQVGVHEFYGIPRWKSEFHQGKEDLKGAEHFVEEQEFKLRTYCAKDAWGGEKISYAHDRQLNNYHNGQKLFQLKRDQSRIAMKMRRIGVKRSKKKLLEHKKRLEGKIEEGKRLLSSLLKIDKLDGEDFNPASPAQLKILFFEVWGLEPIKYTATGEPSLDEETLKHYLSTLHGYQYQFTQTLLRFRQYSKLYGSFIKNDKAVKGIIHAEPKVYGTKTNRWSYKGPNLQTIPKPVVEIQQDGSKVLVSPGLRDMLIPRTGKFWVEADYAKLELWILAVLAKDKRLLEMKRLGLDSHTENAKDLFGVKDFDPKKHKYLRDTAKTFVYNVNYGPADLRMLAQGCWAVMRQTDPKIQLNFVYNLVLKWFKVHPEIDQYRKRKFAEAKRLGYSEEKVSGQRRYYYGRVKDTETYNYEMQTLGAYLIGRAICNIDKDIDWKEDRLLIQVHDALHGESPKPSRLARVLQKHMEEPVMIDGEWHTFPVDFKVGSSWGEAQEFGTVEEIEEWERKQ